MDSSGTLLPIAAVAAETMARCNTIGEAFARSCGSMPGCSSSEESSADDEAGLDVYVLMRPFSEFGGPTLKHVPRPVRRGLADIGVCHYLTAFRTPDGRLLTYDFGPLGGDVHVGLPVDQSSWFRPGALFGRGGQSASIQLPGLDSAHHPEASRSLSTSAPSPKQSGTPGQIRERELEALPLHCLHVGRTSLTLDDIREYNRQQHLRYNLNCNDCRHYVNNLVLHATGVQGASSSLIKHLHATNQERPRWNHRLKRLAQNLTDVNNWPAIRSFGITVGQATLTAAAVVIGRLGVQPLVRHSPMVFSASAGLATPATQAAGLLTRPIRAGSVASVGSWASDVRESRFVRRTVMLGSRVSRTVRRSLVGAVRVVVGRPPSRSFRNSSRNSSFGFSPSFSFSSGSAAQSASLVASRSLSSASSRARVGVARLLTFRKGASSASASSSSAAPPSSDLPRTQPPRLLALASILGSREIGR